MKVQLQRFLAICLLIIGTVTFVMAAPQVRLIPSQKLILGNDEVHFTIVLEDNSAGEGLAVENNPSQKSSSVAVSNVHTIQFTVNANTPNLVSPTMVDVSGSWLGSGTTLTATPSDISGPLPTSLRISRNDALNAIPNTGLVTTVGVS